MKFMISLKSKIARKILTLFFLNKGERFYINELAKTIKEDPSNVYKKLFQLKEEKIILDEFQGKERFFFLNKKYPLLKEYKKIVLKGLGFETTLREKLRKIKSIKAAYLFGSYAKGKLSTESDIDLLVVGDFKTIELQKALLEIQKFIGKEINSVEMSEKEFNKRKKEKDGFLTDVFSQKYIKIL